MPCTDAIQLFADCGVNAQSRNDHIEDTTFAAPLVDDTFSVSSQPVPCRYWSRRVEIKARFLATLIDRLRRGAFNPLQIAGAAGARLIRSSSRCIGRGQRRPDSRQLPRGRAQPLAHKDTRHRDPST